MDEINDRELFRVRLRFLDLIQSFFVVEPDAEKISRWRGTFAALIQERVSPNFDRVVRELSDALNSCNLEDVQNEYSKLFVNPFDGGLVHTSASFYIDGRNFGQSLVEIRGLLNEAGLVKEESVTDPEDSLVVMLDAFASLVEEEKSNAGELVKELQGRLLSEFLEPFAAKFTEALEAKEDARFYTVCCRFLKEYLELERSLVIA